MPSRGRRELIELARKYLHIRNWYLSLSEKERESIPYELKKDIELLIRVLEG